MTAGDQHHVFLCVRAAIVSNSEAVHTGTKAQWEILAIFVSLQNPDFIQILGNFSSIFGPILI